LDSRFNQLKLPAVFVLIISRTYKFRNDLKQQVSVTLETVPDGNTCHIIAVVGKYCQYLKMILFYRLATACVIRFTQKDSTKKTICNLRPNLFACVGGKFMQNF